ncbi:MAG: M2 family metallopeptidase [Planctomycetota bacterium]
MTQEAQLSEQVGLFSAAFLPLERARAEAWWASSTKSSDENEKALEQAENAYQRFLADEEAYQRFKEAAGAEVGNSVLKRQIDVVHRMLASHRMDEKIIERLVPLGVEIESEYNRFRAKLGGKEVSDNEISEILRKTEDPAAAQAAWEAAKQIGPRVSERVLELVALRNEIARKNGYENYQVMSLELSELEPESLFQLLGELERDTEAPFAEIKAELDGELAAKFGIEPSELRPCHYGDPFFQSAPQTGGVDLDRFYDGKNLEALTKEFFDGVDMEIEDILKRSDLYEREGKCQHAFCIHLDRREDVRVLCNNRPTEYWMGTMLHEFGHAVYDKYLGGSLPELLREPAHILSTEAIAMLFGRLSREKEFLVEIAGAEESDAESVAAAAREELRRNEIIFVRWALVVVHFERELYKNPQRDLDTLWWDLVERFQHLKRPEGRSAPDWATKIHIATVPVYYQNYILGDLMASQLLHHMLEQVLGGKPSVTGERAIGSYLTEKIFEPGNRSSWNELLEDATGEKLSARHFIREFAAK